MWFSHRRPNPEPLAIPLDVITVSTQPKGTPSKRRIKHTQSARKCDCYKDSQDKNIERDYILNFLTKTVPQQKKEKKCSKKEKNKNARNESNRSKFKILRFENIKNDNDILKKFSSITLRRNRIIPLNDGSGHCVLVSQSTTIKETPRQNEPDEPLPKEERTKKKLCGLFKFISTIKRKTHKFLINRTLDKQSGNLEENNKKSVSAKHFGESVPIQGDFVEKNFQDEDRSEDCVIDKDRSEEFGRLSACSSGYFTPEGETPVAFRRASPVSEIVCDESDEELVATESSCREVLAESIEQTLNAMGAIDREELLRRSRAGEPLYPNCDSSIWMRSCDHEVLDPIQGDVSGIIPVWLRGTLLRNGPGSMRVGDNMFKHMFDGSALIHRFALNNGAVTYQCRFLKSQTYLKNHAANRITVNEFGTQAVPDPCQSIFQRVSALFDSGESLSDNAMISVYPFGDEYYCFTESPVIHRIDPITLETLERVNVSKHVAVVNHTSHPHVAADGSVFNQALSVQCGIPHYAIVKFPIQEGVGDKCKDRRTGQMFEKAELVASVRARWPLHPSYMHTFGLTDHFYVIVEQPLSISVPGMFKAKLTGQPMGSCFRFFKDKPTLMHVVERESGKLYRTYVAEAFFYLHIVNQFEKDGHLVLDICCYSDPAMIDCMYYDSLKEINKNLDYARFFRGRPMRFVLPLTPAPAASSGCSTNLVNLEGSRATACWEGGDVLVRPELLCHLGCETPRINYTRHLGKPYRYFYAISSDVDADNPGTIIKVDTLTRSCKTWGEPGVYPSEPIFVPSPDPQDEDDGVLLSALVWGQDLDTQVGMLVMDAKSMHELGRAVFQTTSPVPKCLHGWFSPDL